ncbi:MAG: glycosyltransferase family 4 protein [bacterium]
MGKPVLHQFVAGASPGDAITDQALLLRRWIRKDGFRSDIFAESIHPGLADEVRSYSCYHARAKGEIVILHHSIGTDVVDCLLSQDLRIVVVYHNVTPPEFVQHVDPGLARQLEKGRQQLEALKSSTILGLADSSYNEEELRSAGYNRTGVLPIMLDEARYEVPSNPELLRMYRDGSPNLLFVGRLVPNKCQEDLIKLLYHYRRIEPSARLFLVGSPWLPTYADWLRELAEELEVSNGVVFAGYVSQKDLVTYFRLADAYLSMSEHEGFGKPFIESMYHEVPILAYKAAAVPETLGGAGILFSDKDYEVLAELLSLLLQDEHLQGRIRARERKRMKDFLKSGVREVWNRHMAAFWHEATTA